MLLRLVAARRLVVVGRAFDLAARLVEIFLQIFDFRLGETVAGPAIDFFFRPDRGLVGLQPVGLGLREFFCFAPCLVNW